MTVTVMLYICKKFNAVRLFIRYENSFAFDQISENYI